MVDFVITVDVSDTVDIVLGGEVGDHTEHTPKIMKTIRTTQNKVKQTMCMCYSVCWYMFS